MEKIFHGTDRKFSRVNGIALRARPFLSLFGLHAMSELMVYNPWCESEIYASRTIYTYIGLPG